MQENSIKIKIKKTHKDAVIPKYAKPGDAGLDLTATEVYYEEKDGLSFVTYKTGLAFEIPKGYVGLIFPRSSVYKVDLQLSNAVGVIDSSYRGEVSLNFKPIVDYWGACYDDEFQEDLEKGSLNVYNNGENEHYGFSNVTRVYSKGDRVGQIIIMPYPQIEFEEVEELTETERGAGGFGSTGK